jgi:Protein of unknown function (DUF1236)
MTKSALLASTAVALIWCAAPATAQMQKEQAPNAQPGAEPRDKGSVPGKSEPQGKGSAQSQPKDTAPKGNSQKSSEPTEKSTKGQAEKSPEPKEKSTKGAAEKAAPQEKSTKGTAEKSAPTQEKSTKGAAEKGTQPKDKAATEKSGSARVQLSDQQRTNVHQTLLKESNVNRATNLNVSINVGTRVPRSVRLAVLPASVIVVVPEYRSYRYFVVDDRICIVEPNTYEIVEIISVSGQSATREDRGTARLVLTEDEKRVVLDEVDMSGGSTLALGSLNEGAEVPRGVEVRTFPTAIVEKVPKLKRFKYFTVENRLAVVDSQGAKVQLVIDAKR